MAYSIVEGQPATVVLVETKPITTSFEESTTEKLTPATPIMSTTCMERAPAIPISGGDDRSSPDDNPFENVCTGPERVQATELFESAGCSTQDGPEYPATHAPQAHGATSRFWDGQVPGSGHTDALGKKVNPMTELPPAEEML